MTIRDGAEAAPETATPALGRERSARAGLPLMQQPERLKARLREVPAEPGCYL